MNSVFTIFIASLLFVGGCGSIKEILPTNRPSASAKRSNLIDSTKILHPELITDVRIGKMQDDISIVFEDGTRIDSGQTFTVADYSPGFVNPGNGFTELFSQSSGKKCTLKRRGKSDLYGIMEFSKVYKNCASLPATRSYYIKIPDSYLADATGGNITAVYEYYQCEPPLEDVRKGYYTTWSLWISDVPF